MGQCNSLQSLMLGFTTGQLHIDSYPDQLQQPVIIPNRNVLYSNADDESAQTNENSQTHLPIIHQINEPELCSERNTSEYDDTDKEDIGGNDLGIHAAEKDCIPDIEDIDWEKFFSTGQFIKKGTPKTKANNEVTQLESKDNSGDESEEDPSPNEQTVPWKKRLGLLLFCHSNLSLSGIRVKALILISFCLILGED